MSDDAQNEIAIPYQWEPRGYQEAAWNALEGGCKRVIMLWHRRAGKDLTAIHWCATQAFQRPGLYWHLFPTYSQGRKVIWEGADRAGTPFLNAFPEGTWYRRRDEDMTLWLHGGSRYQVVGTDYIDRLMGANPVGVILSEYALQNHQAWELIRPILAENGGWAVFPYTPRGRNHGYRLFRDAVENPNWFVSKLTVDDTNSIAMEAIEEDRASGMPEEMVQQEYWCFPAGSRVHTFGGQVPIEDITVGTRVLTHTGRFRRVTATHSRETGEPLVSIKTFGHYERLRLTPKHPVRTIDPATQTYGWTPAMDVKKGDWLVLPRMRHGRTFVSRDLAWLAAWYIAEGSVQKTAVQWSLGYGEMDVAESLREAAGGQAFILEKPPEIHVQVNDTRLADMLAARCGSASNEKRIPWDFVSGHEQLFFDQLMRGDGCDTDRGWSYTTTSLTLAHDVQALASSLGLQSGIAFRKGVKDGTIGGRAVCSADSYCVQISRGKPSAMMRPAKNGIAVRVRDVIVESPEDRTVYNLSVQHDESYVVSGRVVHNCSFEAAMVGAYYGEQLAWMREQDPARISDEVVWAPNKEVVTGWDLGYGDRTAIWFAQVIRNELRLIDYYECSGEPIDHYVKVMREKPYVYGDAFLPHDAAAKSLQTGKSILEQLYSLGVRAIVNPQLSKEDKIGAVRLALRTTWIAEKACETGLSALSEYVKKQDVNQRGLNNEILYLDQPLRNWATHGSDALAELVIGFRPDKRSEFRQPDASYVT